MSDRPWTPDRKTETGTVITVKRACNGCGQLLGDVTEEEIERGIAGLPLTDVRGECRTCSAGAGRGEQNQ